MNKTDTLSTEEIRAILKVITNSEQQINNEQQDKTGKKFKPT